MDAAQLRESLEMECRLRFIKHVQAHPPGETADVIDLWIDGFWAGVKSYAMALIAAGGDPLTLIEGFGR